MPNTEEYFDRAQAMGQDLAKIDKHRHFYAGLAKECSEIIVRCLYLLRANKRGLIHLTPKQILLVREKIVYERERGKALFNWDIFTELSLTLGSTESIEYDK